MCHVFCVCCNMYASYIIHDILFYKFNYDSTFTDKIDRLRHLPSQNTVCAFSSPIKLEKLWN